MPLAITLLNHVITVDHTTFDTATLLELQNYIAGLPDASPAFTLQLQDCIFTEELNILQFCGSTSPKKITDIVFNQCEFVKSITPNTLQEFIKLRCRLYVRVISKQGAISPPELAQLHHFCNWLHYTSHHCGAAHLAQQAELSTATQQTLDLQYLAVSYEFQLMWDFEHRLDIHSEEYERKTRELAATTTIITGSNSHSTESANQLVNHLMQRLTWLGILQGNVDSKAQREHHTHTYK